MDRRRSAVVGLTAFLVGAGAGGFGASPARAAGCSGADCFQETASPASVPAGSTYTYTATSASCRNASDQVGLANPTSVRKAISVLAEREFVVGAPDGWQIDDPFLAEWLRREAAGP
jgi:hypothetical protein